MRRAAQEFSRFAGTYSQHNLIQAKVAKKLVSMLPEKDYGSILDLGCGRGEIYRNLKAQQITFRHLTAMDISAEMLELHPEEEKLVKFRGDFNLPPDISSLPLPHYDLLISSSALQWSSDLDVTLPLISTLSDQCYCAVFTSETFRSLHHFAGIKSPIYSEKLLREKIGKYLDPTFETVRYTLAFDSVYKMLRYIKESGTSGGERYMGYRQTKKLLESYPHDHLEFEVLFVSPKS